MAGPRGSIKGVVLKSRLGFVRENKGEPGLQSVLARLPEADRAAMNSLLPSSWYPFELNERLDQAIAQAKGGEVDPVLLAFYYTHLGEHSRAIDYLERAYGEHNSDIPFIMVQPSFDPLRRDPRFQALARRISPRLLPGQRS